MLCVLSPLRGCAPRSSLCAALRLPFRRLRLVHDSSGVIDPSDKEDQQALIPIVIHENGARALRKREHGNKPLPLPPHMDPVRVAQRNKWKGRKPPPPPESEMTEFQKRLKNNIYAQALATPVRHCNVTSAHLPSSLLLAFALVPHRASQSHAVLPLELFHETRERDEFVASMASKVTKRSYIQLHQALLEHASQAGKWKTVVAPHHREELLRTSMSDLTWRLDMQDFVLGILRDLVERELRSRLDARSRGGLEAVVSPEAVADPLEEVELLILLRPPASPYLEKLALSEAKLDVAEKELAAVVQPLLSKASTMDAVSGNHVPAMLPQPDLKLKPALEFPVVELGERSVPLYPLRTLLGSERCEGLFSDLDDNIANILVVRYRNGRQVPSKLHRQLLRLQMYLAKP